MEQVREPYPKLLTLAPIFLVPKVPEGVRLIHDLRYLNQYIQPTHPIKYNSLQSMLMLIKQGDLLSVVDISKAFLHLKVHPLSRPLLAFQLGGKVYQWTTCPFGTKLSPMVWLKVFKSVTTVLSQLRIRQGWWMDDGLVISSPPQAQRDLLLTLRVIEAMGFLVSPKSQLLPSTQQQYLGYTIDTQLMVIKLAPRRRHNILHTLGRVLRKGAISVPKIRELLGKLASAG